MYRMIIVDDLTVIVDGLAGLFREQSDMELELYEAYSAYEAIDILRKAKIDIVLSDIKMPGMEGIELLHEIRLYWPSCKVIFLTSFDDFHYVKDAISGGGFDYILKTESDETIVGTVRKAIAQLDREYEEKKQLHQAQLQHKQAVPVLQQEYFRAILHGEAVPSEARLSERFCEMDIPLSPYLPVCLLLGRIDSWEDKAQPADRKLMLFSVQNIVAEHLQAEAISVSVAIGDTNVLWLVQPKEAPPGSALATISEPGKPASTSAGQSQAVADSTFTSASASASAHSTASASADADRRQADWARIVIFAYGSLEPIQKTCRDLLRLPVSFLIGEQPVRWAGLQEAFEALNSLFLGERGSGRETRLSDAMIRNAARSAADSARSKLQSLKLKKIGLLGHYLENGSKEAFDTLFEDMMSVAPDDRFSGLLKLEVYHGLASVFLSYLNLHPPDDSVMARIRLDKLTRIDANRSWEAARAYFADLAAILFAHRAEVGDRNEREVVLWINDYIASHLSEDLSLARLAAMVHHNPSYLSRLYKQATGIGLSDHINSVRLAKAKELLKNSSCRIYEIAGMIGYDSRLSFIRFFKTQMGVTPQEYRDS